MHHDTIFQFLHGAIKSAGRQCCRCCHYPFQFLHGAIKSFITRESGNLNDNFNSFMVRLKVGEGAQRMINLLNFNSFMVRLKVVNYFLNALCMPFQFLHGAIKRPPLPVTIIYNGDFNSFMVRLKVLVRFTVPTTQCISIPSWCD